MNNRPVRCICICPTSPPPSFLTFTTNSTVICLFLFVLHQTIYTLTSFSHINERSVSRLISVPCALVFGTDSSPAVSQQALQDVRGSWRAEDRPLDASVLEVAAVDLMGAEPLLDSLLDAVSLREAHRARSRGKAVVHKVHRVLSVDKRERKGDKRENESVQLVQFK